ncbi:GerAB/ArcD/ProY family transporter [Mangrovibacillus cuniculi]|uniref:GerAB/ArcD/ProY family transporter n=1 Tax=Mangrovibacillus cuniculi TaxID=2593652 RepID=A0A7S8HEV3_9BACI|nr:GerAB/ArcD/ProY family transporter [Mangrovibacillus cuniculi]QPC46148.1 GerAB/ArcD/ProY family transporter [Mangrovibacillus cuniculi]
MRKWFTSIQVAAVYVGTVVGAGFATGREIIEFFTQYGFIGIIGVAIAGILFIHLGTKMMILARRIQATSYEQFMTHIFGNIFGQVMNLLLLVMLIGVMAVMLSGAGAVFQEQLQYSKQIGVWLTMLLAFIVMIVGTRGLVYVNTVVVPIMIFLAIMLFVHAIGQPLFLEQNLVVPVIGEGWRALLSPFSYAALNLILAQAVLVPLATEVDDEEVIKRGGWLGGVFLTLILLGSHMTLSIIPDVTSYEIPMAVAMSSFLLAFYGFYMVVIYGEVFTSIIGSLYGLEKQLLPYVRIPRLFIQAGLLLVAYFISFFDYSLLLSILYPIFGYVSLLFLVLLWRNKEV